MSVLFGGFGISLGTKFKGLKQQYRLRVYSGTCNALSPAPAPASLLVSGGAALPAVRTPGLQPASQPAQAVAQA